MSTVCLINSARAEILIDVEDFELVARHTWTVVREVNGRRYAVRDARGTQLKLHRVVAGTQPGFDTDHWNGNGLDNRRQNLRTATRSQNNYNRGPAKHNRSGFKGVYLARADAKRPWRARIRCDGQIYELGLFATAEQADAAYRKAADELHGDFAWHRRGAVQAATGVA
jgi:hypothetical protein